MEERVKTEIPEEEATGAEPLILFQGNSETRVKDEVTDSSSDEDNEGISEEFRQIFAARVVDSDEAGLPRPSAEELERIERKARWKRQREEDEANGRSGWFVPSKKTAEEILATDDKKKKMNVELALRIRSDRLSRAGHGLEGKELFGALDDIKNHLYSKGEETWNKVSTENECKKELLILLAPLNESQPELEDRLRPLGKHIYAIARAISGVARPDEDFRPDGDGFSIENLHEMAHFKYFDFLLEDKREAAAEMAKAKSRKDKLEHEEAMRRRKEMIEEQEKKTKHIVSLNAMDAEEELIRLTLQLNASNLMDNEKISKQQAMSKAVNDVIAGLERVRLRTRSSSPPRDREEERDADTWQTTDEDIDGVPMDIDGEDLDGFPIEDAAIESSNENEVLASTRAGVDLHSEAQNVYSSQEQNNGDYVRASYPDRYEFVFTQVQVVGILKRRDRMLLTDVDPKSLPSIGDRMQLRSKLRDQREKHKRVQFQDYSSNAHQASISIVRDFDNDSGIDFVKIPMHLKAYMDHRRGLYSVALRGQRFVPYLLKGYQLPTVYAHLEEFILNALAGRMQLPPDARELVQFYSGRAVLSTPLYGDHIAKAALDADGKLESGALVVVSRDHPVRRDYYNITESLANQLPLKHCELLKSCFTAFGPRIHSAVDAENQTNKSEAFNLRRPENALNAGVSNLIISDSILDRLNPLRFTDTQLFLCKRPYEPKMVIDLLKSVDIELLLLRKIVYISGYDSALFHASEGAFVSARNVVRDVQRLELVIRSIWHEAEKQGIETPALPEIVMVTIPETGNKELGLHNQMIRTAIRKMKSSGSQIVTLFDWHSRLVSKGHTSDAAQRDAYLATLVDGLGLSYRTAIKGDNWHLRRRLFESRYLTESVPGLGGPPIQF